MNRGPLRPERSALPAALLPEKNTHSNARNCDQTRMGFAGAKGLEPSISGVTGQRDNQLRYAPVIFIFYKIFEIVSIGKSVFL